MDLLLRFNPYLFWRKAILESIAMTVRYSKTIYLVVRKGLLLTLPYVICTYNGKLTYSYDYYSVYILPWQKDIENCRQGQRPGIFINVIPEWKIKYLTFNGSDSSF